MIYVCDELNDYTVTDECIRAYLVEMLLFLFYFFVWRLTLSQILFQQLSTSVIWCIYDKLNMLQKFKQLPKNYNMIICCRNIWYIENNHIKQDIKSSIPGYSILRMVTSTLMDWASDDVSRDEGWAQISNLLMIIDRSWCCTDLHWCAWHYLLQDD